MTQLDVVTLGETMVSLRTGTPLRLGGTMTMTVAGAESNVAIGLARLGHTVRWGGRVGADEVGAFILRTMRAESVAVDTVLVDARRPTGLMLAERRVADISRVSYYRAGSAGSALAPADAVACLADTPRILHVTGITPALSGSAADAVATAVELARHAGALVSVDVNYRSSLWAPEDARLVLSELVRGADIVIASEDELGLVVTDARHESAAAEELAASGVSHLVIKRGARGASVWQQGQAHHATAVPVTVLDTIGAGDAFTAGYLSGVLDGLSPAAALYRGTVTGAFAVAGVGDWEGLPSREELSLLETEAGSTLR
ncbi:MAG TPA: sugar kinase [Dermatophilaceae bacterium]|nr:sugar kinase [Dermatophilaceae bacterium]